jgi:hypothetical protein
MFFTVNAYIWSAQMWIFAKAGIYSAVELSIEMVNC